MLSFAYSWGLSYILFTCNYQRENIRQEEGKALPATKAGYHTPNLKIIDRVMPLYISFQLFSKHYPENNVFDVSVSLLKLKFYRRKYFLSKQGK